MLDHFPADLLLLSPQLRRVSNGINGMSLCKHCDHRKRRQRLPVRGKASGIRIDRMMNIQRSLRAMLLHPIPKILSEPKQICLIDLMQIHTVDIFDALARFSDLLFVLPVRLCRFHCRSHQLFLPFQQRSGPVCAKHLHIFSGMQCFLNQPVCLLPHMLLIKLLKHFRISVRLGIFFCHDLMDGSSIHSDQIPAIHKVRRNSFHLMVHFIQHLFAIFSCHDPFPPACNHF